ncbi:hypothetical protein [Trinickia dinghuensis]|uniref:Uncharacterized protein n=1 Tax=Trinickia dinghuensis TaxID=2291023 RepID=A0A3D8K3K0_9BURK|nr:hypothetical protein [Trinickia dinghuensis]RDU99878.1 hypothetical protein DWV00_05590 [Trinickia dinghuensis]
MKDRGIRHVTYNSLDRHLLRKQPAQCPMRQLPRHSCRIRSAEISGSTPHQESAGHSRHIVQLGKTCSLADIQLNQTIFTIPGTAIPGMVQCVHFMRLKMSTPNIEVLVHVQNVGDVKVGPNEYAGVPGKEHRIEGYEIKFTAPAGLGLLCMAHVSDRGDIGWFKDGEFVGGRGQKQPLQGFAIKLTGENAAQYEIRYMAYQHNGAQTGWAKNGEFCGTRGQNMALDAIVVKLVPKMLFQRDYTQYNTNRGVPPSVCAFGGQFHCFYQQPGNDRLTHIRSSNGLYWHSKREIANIDLRDKTSIVTSSGPCSIVFNNKLYVFFRAERDNRVYYIVSPDGEQWSGPQATDARAMSHLSVATTGDSLVVAYRNFEGDGIMYYKLRTNGQSTIGNTGHNTSANRPGIVAFKGKYHIFYKDGGTKHDFPRVKPRFNTGVMHIVSADGQSWQAARDFHVLNTQTSASPTAVAYDGALHLLYRDDSGNAVFHVFSTDGDAFEWAEPYNTGFDIDEGPSAAVLEDTLCLLGVDAGGKNGIMRAVHFPLIESPLKGWDCIVALDSALVPKHLRPCSLASREMELPDTLRDHFLGAHLEPGIVDAATNESDTAPIVSFPVSVRLKGEERGEAANIRLIVAPSPKVVPSQDHAGGWDIVLDFEHLSSQPRLDGMHGDPAAIAQLRDMLSAQVVSQPALRLGSIDALIGNAEMFKMPRFRCVEDPKRPNGILLVLFSTKDKAPDVDDRTFTPSILPDGSDAALYVCNDRVIRLVGGAVQAKLRQSMGDQKKHGANDLTYQYEPVPNAWPRVRASTGNENCRFWHKSREPKVDWSWVDAAHSRVTVDLRLRVTVVLDTTAVYVEAMPSLTMQIGDEGRKISFQLETPIPRSHEEKGMVKWCADDEATDGANELAKELGDTLSGIAPIDTRGFAQFTHASINRLGELFIAAKRKK